MKNKLFLSCRYKQALSGLKLWFLKVQIPNLAQRSSDFPDMAPLEFEYYK